MTRKTFTEILSGRSYDQLHNECVYISQLREQLELTNEGFQFKPYENWLMLYHRAIYAAIRNDWKGVSIFGALANCERYPKHLKTTLL